MRKSKNYAIMYWEFLTEEDADTIEELQQELTIEFRKHLKKGEGVKVLGYQHVTPSKNHPKKST